MSAVGPVVEAPTEIEELRRTATGYVETVTTCVGDVHRVVRTPGSLRADVLAAPPRALPVTSTEVAWSLPDADGGHVVPGPLSAAALLLGGVPGSAVLRMVAPVGAALAHAARLEAPARPAPSGLRRLRRWLSGAATPTAESRRLRELLDEHGLRPDLRAWADDLVGAPRAYSLGAPGLGALYPHPDGARTVVLVTDEVASAPPVWDLGWLLGELLELVNDPDHAPAPRPVHEHPIAQAVLERYAAVAPPPDPDALARAALLRWVVHLHDFTAYVGWDDQLPRRVARIAELARMAP
ncbi:hypothetical protein RDV89_08625 [Nocardioides zeae]|uniref:Aminoglycoside phosphotransferase domain-containing protein n=1 Tax=Nocardioides imazamoxiresistens TaxID=3231893 RepID=A0ABU3PWJ6_9ACTN|nr:hypothetical protein [Nocardioides zeae]MDT9593130.1 hypothetical protein [Nocardioides zeae]